MVRPWTKIEKATTRKAALKSAIEVTYTWTLEPGAKKLDQDYSAFLHFLDSHRVLLFAESHLPSPPPSTWEPGKTYSYTRTKFIPIYPYVGEVEVRMGLYPSGRGERVRAQEHRGAHDLVPANNPDLWEPPQD